MDLILAYDIIYHKKFFLLHVIFVAAGLKFVLWLFFNTLKSIADVITAANEKAKITEIDLLWYI
jgi:hypothetical protein